LKGYERNPFDRSIDVQVARLRAKIEPDKKQPRYIRTVWGRGYMFTPHNEG
jgi:two-component system phosphate regulon response regulator OmpR